MARVSNITAVHRRNAVTERWARGESVTAIARVLGVDWRTVKRDVVFVGRALVAETDVPAQLHRLLRAAQAVESGGWEAEQLGLVLGAIKAQVTILQTIQGLDLAQRLEALEQRVASIVGEGQRGPAVQHRLRPV